MILSSGSRGLHGIINVHSSKYMVYLAFLFTRTYEGGCYVGQKMAGLVLFWSAGLVKYHLALPLVEYGCLPPLMRRG